MTSRKTSILVVDDDVHILRITRRTLELEGYKVLTAGDGPAALEVFAQDDLALVILDIVMPGMDGYALCQRLRNFSQVPIIMLTAKDNEEEKVRGLEVGADDYVTKPFSTKELAARVRAVLRRTQATSVISTQSAFRSGDLEINFAQRLATLAGNKVSLTPTEYELLQELAVNRGKVLTYTHLLNKVWGSTYRDEKEYLHVFVNRLRAKLHTDSTAQKYISTVPGVGYQFSD